MTSFKSVGSILTITVVAWAIIPANALDGAPFAISITELTEDLGADIDDECWNAVTFQPHLDAGQTDYAWVPHSQLSPEALALAPVGAWAYKRNYTTDLLYSKVEIVAVDAPDAALVFGEAEPFLDPYKTFAEVEAASLPGWQAMAQTGIMCTKADDRLDADYSKFAWIPVDDEPERALGAFVFELKDGSGIVIHPDLGGSDEDGDSETEDMAGGEETTPATPMSTSSCVLPRITMVTTLFVILVANYFAIRK